MKFFAFVLVAICCGATVSALPRKDELQCKAPNGGGITPVIKEFIDMLPLDKILNIYLNAVTSDAEVQEVLEYLETEEFQSIVKTIVGTPEYSKLVKLACTDLFLDVVYYVNVLFDILNIPPIPRPTLLNGSTKARPGVHGLLLDLIDVIDVDALRKLFEEKAKSDEYVKQALEIIKSKDFMNIIDALHKTPAYMTMLDDLRKMGVKVDAIIEFLKKYLGMTF